MKYTALIILFIFSLFVLSCDNDEISDQQAESFIKFYGAEMKDKGVSVLTLDDGYMILANIENPDEGQDICVIRTDIFGNSTQDPMVIGGPFEDIGHAMVENEEGFIIAGSTRGSEHGSKNAYIIQIDKKATEIIWEVDTGFTKDDELRDLIILENGNIAACGYTETDNDGKNVFLLERDKSNGDIKLSQQGDKHDEVINSIIKTPSEYMLVGYQGMPITSTSPVTRRVLAYRWGGGNLSPVSHDLSLSYDVNREFVDIVPISETEYYLACNVTEIESNDSEIHFIKMDISFNNNYQDIIVFGERNTNLASDLKISGNNLYISGTSSNTSLKGDMFVVKANLDGTNPVYYYKGDGSSYEGFGFDLAKDGGFIISGAAYTSDQSAIALGKISK